MAVGGGSNWEEDFFQFHSGQVEDRVISFEAKLEQLPPKSKYCQAIKPNKIGRKIIIEEEKTNKIKKKL